MKYNGPKVKLSRRLGLPLTNKAAKVMERKPYPPGQHGPAKQFRRGRQSAFERQLLEKQRLRAQYNLSEKQMGNYYKKALRMQGNTADNLVHLLESRLDAVVLRSGMASSIYAARQIVSHGHIHVNGERVNIASYRVNVGDTISVRPKSQKLSLFQEQVSNAAPPEYIATNKATMSAQFLHEPRRVEVPIVCEVAQVIEYYSR